MTRHMRVVPLSALLVLAAAWPAQAQNWGQLATVSSTMGVSASRICIGEGTRGDVGCPSYTPSITTAGDVSVTGNLSASKFIGDGSGLTGIGSGDRITSGTSRIIVSNSGHISFTTAGTERMVIDSSGNVGISTTTPELSLQLDKRFGVRNDGLVYWGQDIRSASYTNRGYLSWNSGYSSIGSSGNLVLLPVSNVGIGTTAPTSALQVSGTFTVSSTVTNANPALYVSTSGRVGIGTSNLTGAPHSGLFINDSNVNNSPGVSFATAGVERGSIAVNPSFMTLSNVPASGLRFVNANGTLLTVSGSGNVGIGTTSPNKTLAVSGTAEINSRTIIGGSGTPSATLQVRGSLLLAGNDNIPCTNSALGLVRRNPTTGRLQVCK